MSVSTEIAVSILAAVAILTLLGALGVALIIASAWQDYQRTRSAAATTPSLGLSGAALFRRALARKCPACGCGAIESSIFRMNPACPHCGVMFWRAEGEWMGPTVINYFATFSAALAAWAVLVLLNAPEWLQLVLASAAAVLAVLLATPWSRSFWTLFLYLNGEVR